MRDALLMRGLEPVGDLPCDGKRFLQRNRPFLDSCRERRPFDQLHHQVVGAHVVERANVGMVQRTDDAGLTLEALTELLVADLDGNVASEACIPRTVDLAHAAFADGFNDLVRSKFVPRRQ
jgi:hypothetical protein